MTETTSIRSPETLMYPGWSTRSLNIFNQSLYIGDSQSGTHHAAHKMTISTATAVAMAAIIATNLRSSRCNVVKRVASIDESLAIVPLKSR